MAMIIGFLVVAGIGITTVAVVLYGIKNGQWPTK